MGTMFIFSHRPECDVYLVLNNISCGEETPVFAVRKQIKETLLH